MKAQFIKNCAFKCEREKMKEKTYEDFLNELGFRESSGIIKK